MALPALGTPSRRLLTLAVLSPVATVASVVGVGLWLSTPGGTMIGLAIVSAIAAFLASAALNDQRAQSADATAYYSPEITGSGSLDDEGSYGRRGIFLLYCGPTAVLSAIAFFAVGILA